MKGITKSAAEMLKHELEEEHVPDGRCVRYVGSAVSGEFEIDRIRPDDRVFKYRGQPVLAVGPETVKLCRGRMLDYERKHFNLSDEESISATSCVST